MIRAVQSSCWTLHTSDNQKQLNVLLTHFEWHDKVEKRIRTSNQMFIHHFHAMNTNKKTKHNNFALRFQHRATARFLPPPWRLPNQLWSFTPSSRCYLNPFILLELDDGEPRWSVPPAVEFFEVWFTETTIPVHYCDKLVLRYFIAYNKIVLSATR